MDTHTLYSARAHAISISALVIAGSLLLTPSSATADATTDAIEDLGSEISTAFTNLGTKVQGVANDASDTLTNTKTIKTTVNTIQNSINTISSVILQLQSMADQGQQLLEYYAVHEASAFNAFVGLDGCGPSCELFRGQLIDTVDKSGQVIDTLLQTQWAWQSEGLPPELSPPPFPRVDFSPLADQLGYVPGFLLYPLYKVLTGLEGLPLQSQLSAAPTALASASCDACSSTLQAIINTYDLVLTTVPKLYENLGIAVDCPFAAQPETRRVATYVTAPMMTGGGLLRFIGALLKGIGKTSINSTQAGVAAAGHLSMKLEHDAAATWGNIFDGIGGFSLQLAGLVTNRLNHCEIVINQEIMMCMIEQRASQGQAHRTGVSLRDYCTPAPEWVALP